MTLGDSKGEYTFLPTLGDDWPALLDSRAPIGSFCILGDCLGGDCFAGEVLSLFGDGDFKGDVSGDVGLIPTLWYMLGDCLWARWGGNSFEKGHLLMSCVAAAYFSLKRFVA